MSMSVLFGQMEQLSLEWATKAEWFIRNQCPF